MVVCVTRWQTHIGVKEMSRVWDSLQITQSTVRQQVLQQEVERHILIQIEFRPQVSWVEVRVVV